jgi:hypothetical protein
MKSLDKNLAINSELEAHLVRLFNSIIPSSEDGRLPPLDFWGFVSYLVAQNSLELIEYFVQEYSENFDTRQVEISQVISSRKFLNLMQETISLEVVNYYYRKIEVIRYYRQDLDSRISSGNKLLGIDYDLLEKVYERGSIYLPCLEKNGA